jgi:hypothetical protein
MVGGAPLHFIAASWNISIVSALPAVRSFCSCLLYADSIYFLANRKGKLSFLLPTAYRLLKQ